MTKNEQLKEVRKTKSKKLPRRDKFPEPHFDEFNVLFEKMDSTENDFVGRDEENNWFYIDPFVGCAWSYEDRKTLIGKQARVKGFWSLNSKNAMPVFLIDEGGIDFIQFN